ncbi:uncharacterized protein LOC110104559 [Dendrobium catenatum]|uniref:Uncharacterized protein n=1 Tax=Dendrobium catenatum TaxID=906689 RepID=A0A2I0WR13_9ASPA|nr:uncharacterized protein LOC110104559 [Dendrobium catenatum]PKU78102.1 hypothetical protein MA16_Dca013168 [Dendrobium catenatum]
MATLTAGVLLKLLQSMNSDSKPFGEHRSAVLQVTGIVPAPSDDLWSSHGFYLQLSDSLHSTYVSLSDQEADVIVSNRPQLGQLVHLDRLHFDLPVPRALGLRPISSSRQHPFIGSPEPLIALSTPSHAPGFVIQPASPSSAAATVKPRAVFAPKENVLNAASNSFSSGTTSSVSKPKRRFSSPASRNPSPVPEKQGSRVGSRAPSPVPSKCEVPSLVAAREENRKVAREPAIVVPSRYRQPSPVGRKTAVASPIGRKAVASPGGRRLSGGMKFSPATGDGGGKRKVGIVVAGITKVSDALMMSGRSVRKSWDDNSSSSENSSAENKGNAGSKSKVREQAPMKAQACDATKDKSHNEEESMEVKRRTSKKIVGSVMENANPTAPKCAFYDRKWTDGSIPLDGVSQNLERLGKEAFERRNTASIAAAEALEEALATESIIRSLSMFSELCLASKKGNLLRTINTFLSIYDDVMKETSIVASLVASRTCNFPVDSLSINRAKSTSIWVEAALTTDLGVLNLINYTIDSHTKQKDSEKIAIPCGDYPKSNISKRISVGTNAKSQTKVSATCSATNFWTRGQDVVQTLNLAEALQNEMQIWFLKFVEGAISVGFFIFGEHKKGNEEGFLNDNSRVAAVVFHLKRVSDWIDVVLSKSEDEILVEKIEHVRQKICNFVMTNMGLIKPTRSTWDEANNDDIMTDMGSAFHNALSFGKS